MKSTALIYNYCDCNYNYWGGTRIGENLKKNNECRCWPYEGATKISGRLVQSFRKRSSSTNSNDPLSSHSQWSRLQSQLLLRNENMSIFGKNHEHRFWLSGNEIKISRRLLQPFRKRSSTTVSNDPTIRITPFTPLSDEHFSSPWVPLFPRRVSTDCRPATTILSSSLQFLCASPPRETKVRNSREKEQTGGIFIFFVFPSSTAQIPDSYNKTRRPRARDTSARSPPSSLSVSHGNKTSRDALRTGVLKEPNEKSDYYPNPELSHRGAKRPWREKERRPVSRFTRTNYVAFAPGQFFLFFRFALPPQPERDIVVTRGIFIQPFFVCLKIFF